VIPSIHIENFKCFESVDVELGPFTVLVGPNESGKTAFLQALRVVSLVLHGGTMSPGTVEGKLDLRTGDACLGRNGNDDKIRITIPPEAFDLPSEHKGLLVVATSQGLTPYAEVLKAPASSATRVTGVGDAIREWFGGMAYYRFDPRSLKSPGSFNPPSQLGVDGTGLPGFLDYLLRHDRRKFFDLEERFYTGFPEYEKLEIRSPHDGKSRDNDFSLRFRTRHDYELPAAGISDGAILSLAFLAICHQAQPPKVLMIEEPENGVHHAKLREIIGTLKQITKAPGVQVILTTHSPFLLDLVEPEEVRIFTKDDQGAAHVTKMSDIPDVATWKKDFMTGEIWTSLSEDELVKKAPGNG